MLFDRENIKAQRNFWLHKIERVKQTALTPHSWNLWYFQWIYTSFILTWLIKKVSLMPKTDIEHKTFYRSLHIHESTEYLYLVLNTTLAIRCTVYHTKRANDPRNSICVGLLPIAGKYGIPQLSSLQRQFRDSCQHPDIWINNLFRKPARGCIPTLLPTYQVRMLQNQASPLNSITFYTEAA